MLQVQNLTTTTKDTNQLFDYRLGIQNKEFPEFSFLDHNSSYGSMLYYEPDQHISVILSLNQLTAIHKAEWMMKKISLDLKNEYHSKQ